MTKKTQKKMRKALLMLACAALLVCITIGATVAYLTSEATVTNTFTVGSVVITMDEAKVDVYGVEEADADRVIENSYKLIPGHTYTKDPTIHVDADSEACYVFVTVANDIAAIETDEEGATIAEQLAANDFAPIEEGSNVYVYDKTENAGKDIVVFETFKIAEDADVSSYAGKTVVINAYAVQKDSFGTAKAAWDATFGD